MYLRIILIISPRKKHYTWPNKTAEVVHMSVDNLIISNNPLPEPNDLLQSQLQTRSRRSQALSPYCAATSSPTGSSAVTST